MKPPNPPVPAMENILEWLRSYSNDIFKTLKNISFGDGTNSGDKQNTDTKFLVGTTDAIAGTEKVFTHLLGRVPVGYIKVGSDKAGSLYNGVTAWTATTIYLRSDVASLTFKVILF